MDQRKLRNPRSSGAWLRRAPLGILVIGFALSLLGAGFLVGGAYLAVTRPDTGWMAWLGIIAVGPLLLYIAFHVVRLSPWTWLALIGLAVLLLVSAIARLFLAGTPPLAPLPEIAVELAALGYLTRLRVRRAFGRG